MRVVYADAQSMAYQEEEPRMAISTRTTYDVDIEDVEYLRHGDKPCWRVSSSHAAADRSRSWSNCMAGPGSGEIV